MIVRSEAAGGGETGFASRSHLEGSAYESWVQRGAATFGAIISTARTVGAVGRLAWESDPRAAQLLAVATVAVGLAPPANAYVAKLLINAVVVSTKGGGRNAVLPPPLAALTHGLDGHLTEALVTALLFVALQAVLFAMAALGNSVRNGAQQVLQNALVATVHAKVVRQACILDLTFFEDPSSYDTLRRAQADGATRPIQIVSSGLSLAQAGVTFVAMIGLLATGGWILAGLALAAPIPAFVADTRYGTLGHQLSHAYSIVLRRMSYVLMLATTDNYAKEIRAYDLADYLRTRHSKLSTEYNEGQRRLIASRIRSSFAWGLVGTLAGATIYVYVVIMVAIGRFTLGDLALYTAAAIGVQGSLQGVLSALATLHEHKLYVASLFEFLAFRPRIVDAGRPSQVITSSRGRVEFDNVTFRYPGASAPALEEVSFAIDPGGTVALVGHNGAGKSTVIKLLLRLYDPDSGRVLLDGVDLREYALGDLRGRVAAMFQDFACYQASVADNVGVADINRMNDRSAIESAVARSGAASLVAGLPDGLDTPLGKWFDRRGVNLSGGEWQRIAVSRAFMRQDATVVVLDEPTSALDAAAESDLLHAMQELAGGRTTIWVSHRFSSVTGASRILVFDQGHLIEDGCHAHLVGAGGCYAKMFHLQARPYIAT